MTTPISSPSRFGCAAVLLVAALLSPEAAESAPITTFHTTFFDSSGNLVSGTITASLDFYVRPYGEGFPQGPAVLVDQFSLGTGPGSDFMVFIPQSIIDTHASWEVPSPLGSGQDYVFALPGLDVIFLGFPFPTSIGELGNWCSPLPSGGTLVNTVFPLAFRGGCGFTDKVVNIQDANGVGAVIVNNTEGAGAMQMGLPGFTPSIPVISLSYDRGKQIILALQPRPDGDTTPELGYFDFSARWDPDPVPVPEPASLLLLGTGLAGLGARRWRQRKR